MSDQDYDVVVIGAGSGGLTAADYAATFGARVGLVEKGRIGGDCTWTGCVPSKALLHVGKVAHMARTATPFGVVCLPPSVDMARVHDYVKSAIEQVYQQSTPERLADKGIELIRGGGRFTADKQLRVGEQNLQSEKFIIATGSRPWIPDIPGLRDTPFLTTLNFFDNDRLPKHLLILGAGPVGVEMAQAYRRLGAKVTIVDVELLPDEEPDVREALDTVFAREGVQCIQGLAAGARYENGEFFLEIEGERAPLHGDMLFLATGRQPNVSDLGLEKAGVLYDRSGIRVDRHLRTSARGIYAVGDCLGGAHYTHLAALQGYTAVRNALLPGSSQAEDAIVPGTIFTDPEIARVGLTEAAATGVFGDDLIVSRRQISQVDRAVTDDTKDGFIKVLTKRDGTVVGATIVASSAGELITEFVLALKHGLKVGDLAGAMHVYPSYSIGTQQLAAEITTSSFLSSTLGRVVQRFSGLGS